MWNQLSFLYRNSIHLTKNALIALWAMKKSVTMTVIYCVLATIVSVGWGVTSLTAQEDSVNVMQYGDDAEALQREWADRLGISVISENSIGMKMALIPPGEFMMGSTEDEEGTRNRERPAHKVQITRPFLIGQFEVTQEEFEQVMGYNPSIYSSTADDGSGFVVGMDTRRFPVDSVSWYDAIEYCNKLSRTEGFDPYYELANVERDDEGRITSAEVSIQGGEGFRLPTEAEWEYACRAGTTTPFHFGNACNGTEANVNGTQPYGTDMPGPVLQRTAEVGSYRDYANAFGLFDMHGNVREWCWDWYGEDYYNESPGIDPQGAASDRWSRRVMRGGARLESPQNSRSASRNAYGPHRRGITIGFRVVRTLSPE